MNKKKTKVNYRSLVTLVIGITCIYGCTASPNSPANISTKSTNNSGNIFNQLGQKLAQPVNRNPSGNSASSGSGNVSSPSSLLNSGNYSNSQGTNYFPAVPTGSSNPVGQTGGTSDIKERATLNGKVYGPDGTPLDGVRITARSVDSNISWVSEEQITMNGTYVIRNAPVGARVEITASDGKDTKIRTEVLKSNLQGDPYANVYDFGGKNSFDSTAKDYTIGVTHVSGQIYDGDNQLINVATVKIQSMDPNNPWFKTFITTNGTYNFDEVPTGIDVQITVRVNDKEKSRTHIFSGSFNKINFGGIDDTDKTFAIASQTDNFFVDYGVNPFVDPVNDHLSTFSIDVDTASYTWMRKSIAEENTIPDKKSVRIEEYINFFDYYYPLPTKDSFTINTDIVNSPVGDQKKKIIRIGLQGKELIDQNRKDAILTFVIDVSGSMDLDSRLGLVKQSLELLVKQLKKGDKVGIVVFGSDARVVLEPKSVDNEGEIINAIHSLVTEGSTNTEAGLLEGFKMAQKFYKQGASNRVILCSDGVANVGATGPDAILKKIKEVNEAGIALSTIGFGMGNYNDVLMEQLANKGDGYYSYVDNIKEANRVFVENLNGSLQTIAKDVKVQVDFNPQTVKQYRLLGYENRDIKDEDFRNDSVDAGEVGLNTSVTALYEVELKNVAESGKIATVFLRYKDTDNLNKVREFNKEISGNEIINNFSSASPTFKLAASVALFAEILRHSYWAKDGRFTDVLKIAREAGIAYGNTYGNSEKIDEFISLVEKAAKLQQTMD